MLLLFDVFTCSVSIAAKAIIPVTIIKGLGVVSTCRKFLGFDDG
jgi:hypothetical protein